MNAGWKQHEEKGHSVEMVATLEWRLVQLSLLTK